MKISRVTEMRQLDRTAIENYGIVEELLMENAGDAAYFVILKELGIAGKKFVVFCGSGNNGGDGLVVGRKIHSNGGTVTVFLLGDAAKYQDAASLNYQIIRKLPVEIIEGFNLEIAAKKSQQADAIVDALLGTGLDREVSGKFQDAIELINSALKPVFSLDIPSGISGETGKILGTAVKANFTITFGLPKIGNVLYPGFEHGGKLYATHISFPPELYNQPQIKISTTELKPLPVRQSDGHKGSFGKALFVAGSMNYMGAPFLAALAFLKAGGGLSFLAAPECAVPAIGAKGSEIIFVPQMATAAGTIALSNKNALLDFIQGVDFVVLGPGLSLKTETQQLVRELIREIDKPLLLDGDGISAVAQQPELLQQRKFPTILTPHLGEMARLVGKKISEIDEKKIAVIQATAASGNSIIVLKGAHSLIGFPDGRVSINFSGNSGMATAGSGDVLTGIIAAMFGLGFDLETAVTHGVFLHGFAGDLAAKSKGTDGMVASDILGVLPKALKMYRCLFEEVTQDCYQKIFLI